jgi:hypothetical protein
MRSELRTYWRDPGYWRWWWQYRVSGQAKGAIAAMVAVAFGIAGFLSAERLAVTPEAATFTQRVVTVVRTARAGAPPLVAKSQASTQAADVRIGVLSVTPRPPQAGRSFALVARVEFAPSPGSIRCSVWIGGERYRNIRLTWERSIARCFFRLPDRARGERLELGLWAVLRQSRAGTTLGFTVS